jgi:hypothetical protein
MLLPPVLLDEEEEEVTAWTLLQRLSAAFRRNWGNKLWNWAVERTLLDRQISLLMQVWFWTWFGWTHLTFASIVRYNFASGLCFVCRLHYAHHCNPILIKKILTFGDYQCIMIFVKDPSWKQNTHLWGRVVIVLYDMHSSYTTKIPRGSCNQEFCLHLFLFLCNKSIQQSLEIAPMSGIKELQEIHHIILLVERLFI